MHSLGITMLNKELSMAKKALDETGIINIVKETSKNLNHIPHSERLLARFGLRRG